MKAPGLKTVLSAFYPRCHVCPIVSSLYGSGVQLPPTKGTFASRWQRSKLDLVKGGSAHHLLGRNYEGQANLKDCTAVRIFLLSVPSTESKKTHPSLRSRRLRGEPIRKILYGWLLKQGASGKEHIVDDVFIPDNRIRYDQRMQSPRCGRWGALTGRAFNRRTLA